MKTYNDDITLIDQILNGDTSSFAVIVDRYGDMLLSLAIKITGNTEDAQEVVQDVFVKVYRALNRYKKQSNFSTWLYRITYNTAISKIRKKRIPTKNIYETKEIVTLSDNDIAENLNKLAQEKKFDMVNNAIAMLNPDEKALITLFYLEEKSINEISQIMEISAANTKTKLHRTRKKLLMIIMDMEGKS